MVKILSWNTLESGKGGAWSEGWGCPLEIQRSKDELLKLKKQTNNNNNNNKIINIVGESGGTGGDHYIKCTTTATATATEEEIKEVERILTNQRYARIRKTIVNEMNDNDIDFYLFQEMSVENLWDENNNDNNFTINKNDTDNKSEFEFEKFPPSTYERVPCQDDGDGDGDGDSDKNLQRIYVRKDSGWKSKRSYVLQSDVLEGGCLVEFHQQQYQNQFGFDHGKGKEDDEEDEEEEQQQLFLVNLHGKSKSMRDPQLRRMGITDLWNEIGSYLNKNNANENKNDIGKSKNKIQQRNDSWWMKKIIVCGDFNTHLSDLIAQLQYQTDSSDINNNTISVSSSVLLEPVVGLLRNSTTYASSGTATTGIDSIPVFSTNHEDGFLAQYDGCLFFRRNHNSDVTTAADADADADATPISSSEQVPLSSSISSSSSSSSSSSLSYLELENVSWNITGFMPKGRHGKLPGSEHEEHTTTINNDNGDGNITLYKNNNSIHHYYNNFTYNSHRGDGDGDGVYLNGIFLGSGTLSYLGMSDHIRIYTTIRIDNKKLNEYEYEHEHEHEHQRRPRRHHYYSYDEHDDDHVNNNSSFYYEKNNNGDDGDDETERSRWMGHHHRHHHLRRRGLNK